MGLIFILVCLAAAIFAIRTMLTVGKYIWLLLRGEQDKLPSRSVTLYSMSVWVISASLLAAVFVTFTSDLSRMGMLKLGSLAVYAFMTPIMLRAMRKGFLKCESCGGQLLPTELKSCKNCLVVRAKDANDESAKTELESIIRNDALMAKTQGRFSKFNMIVLGALLLLEVVGIVLNWSRFTGPGGTTRVITAVVVFAATMIFAGLLWRTQKEPVISIGSGRRMFPPLRIILFIVLLLPAVALINRTSIARMFASIVNYKPLPASWEQSVSMNLEDSLASPSSTIRETAIDGLADLGAKEIPRLRQILFAEKLPFVPKYLGQMSDLQLRQQGAIAALGKMRDQGVPLLTEVCSGSNLEVRDEATAVLMSIGTRAAMGGSKTCTNFAPDLYLQKRSAQECEIAWGEVVANYATGRVVKYSVTHYTSGNLQRALEYTSIVASSSTDGVELEIENRGTRLESTKIQKWTKAVTKRQWLVHCQKGEVSGNTLAFLREYYSADSMVQTIEYPSFQRISPITHVGIETCPGEDTQIMCRHVIMGRKEPVGNVSTITREVWFRDGAEPLIVKSVDKLWDNHNTKWKVTAKQELSFYRSH